MPITIRKDTERHRLPLTEGAAIIYRRISAKQSFQFQRRATDNRGNTDWTQVAENMLRTAVLDWEGFVDEEGTPVPFSIDLFMEMPSELHNKLTEVLNKMIVDQDARANGAPSAKNLGSSLSSFPTS